MSQALEESFHRIDNGDDDAGRELIVNPPSGFKDTSLDSVTVAVVASDGEEDDSLKDSGADLTSPKGEEEEDEIELRVRGRPIKVHDGVSLIIVMCRVSHLN